jgi:hypothetical protein
MSPLPLHVINPNTGELAWKDHEREASLALDALLTGPVFTEMVRRAGKKLYQDQDWPVGRPFPQARGELLGVARALRAALGGDDD